LGPTGTAELDSGHSNTGKAGDDWVKAFHQIYRRKKGRGSRLAVSTSHFHLGGPEGAKGGEKAGDVQKEFYRDFAV